MKTSIKVAIIGGIFLVLCAIITGIFTYCSEKEYSITVYLIDDATEVELSGIIYLNGSAQSFSIVKDKNPTVINVTEGRYDIKAESHGYKTEENTYDRMGSPLYIRMKKADDGPQLNFLPLIGWEPRNNNLIVSKGAAENELIIDSRGKEIYAEGVFSTGVINLQNKTLILFFSNTEESDFPIRTMAKIYCGKDRFLLLPVDPTSIVSDEYLPNLDTPPEKGIEFAIPDTFDGTLEFVFYKSTIRNLKITAYYR